MTERIDRIWSLKRREMRLPALQRQKRRKPYIRESRMAGFLFAFGIMPGRVKSRVLLPVLDRQDRRDIMK